MDFFQGSLPSNFISFCLVNQNVDETQTPFNLAPEIPVEFSQPRVPLTNIHPDTSVEQSFGQPNLARLVASPGSIDSQTDVNAFAEAMVQRLESLPTPEPSEVSMQTSAGLGETQESRDKVESTPLSSPNLASSPFQSGEGVSLNISLTQLESTLRVATTSRTQLPQNSFQLQICPKNTLILPILSLMKIMILLFTKFLPCWVEKLEFVF